MLQDQFLDPVSARNKELYSVGGEGFGPGPAVGQNEYYGPGTNPLYGYGGREQSDEQLAAQTRLAAQPQQQQQTQPVAAAQPPASIGAAPIAPEPIPTLEQPKARDWRDTMYMEAREKAMNIADPTQRQIALEGVAQMGMEFHKEYYGKS
jgi:hypothetical protein